MILALVSRPLIAVLLASLLAMAVTSGCANSILRNAGEAGLETALEGPLPTPTLRR